jgi:putative membrane protein insertion efficiency factor
VKYVLMGMLKLYQWTISPMLGPVCRFYPSCSHYAYQAIATHGSLKGCYLTARRLLRCHPWNPGGFDPVPPRRKASAAGDVPGTEHRTETHTHTTAQGA